MIDDSSNDVHTAASQDDTTAEATEVIYCAICTFPPEYCEFGGSLTKCKAWLNSEHPSLFNKLYSVEALEQHTANLTISTDQEAKLSKDLAKLEAKTAAKQSKLQAEKSQTKVIIKRIERGKRKYVTAIANLQTFDVDIKKAAKTLANKFARGASVSKTMEGKEEIVVQGDLVDEIEEFVVENFGVSEDQIVTREEKGGKK